VKCVPPSQPTRWLKTILEQGITATKKKGKNERKAATISLPKKKEPLKPRFTLTHKKRKRGEKVPLLLGKKKKGGVCGCPEDGKGKEEIQKGKVPLHFFPHVQTSPEMKAE